MARIQILSQPFDLVEEQKRLWRGASQVGAVVTFIGLMRDINDGRQVSAMTLEHYPGMTEKALITIADEATTRWDLIQVSILHRVGTLEPQDPIVFVGVSSQHRGDAFKACEFLMDYLKTQAPFWKKEHTSQGERWVEARASDQQSARRWDDAG